MSLEEILSNITILANNCTNHDLMLWVTLIGGAIWAILMIIAVILGIREGQPKIVILLCGFFILLGTAAIVISMLEMTNESLRLRYTEIELYIRLNDVSIEDISKYFNIHDSINNDGQIYANITPIYEHGDEIRRILHNMGII